MSTHESTNPFSPPRPLLSPRPPLRMAAAALFSSMVLAATGCATPMLRADVAMPDAFMGRSAAVAAQDAEAAWWKTYDDPVLTALIERAATENRDILIAGERVRAARAGETVSKSWLLPGVSLSANSGSSRNDYDSDAQRVVPESDNRSAGLAVSWEIDVTGRLRAGAKASKAETEAAESTARGVRLMVLSDVASNYFILSGALRQLDAVSEISAAQDETLRLVVARHRVGLASSFDVERARADAERTRAAIPPLETLVAMSRHRLAVLLGDPPAAAATFTPWVGGVNVPHVPAGQPAELLERRPDLLALQAQLDASNWRRRQAAAEWFPRLMASALFGRQDAEFNGVGLGSAGFGNVAALLTMPLFNAGRTGAINDAADAAQNESLLRYEDGIIRALEDVENALVQLQSGRQRATFLGASSASADTALVHAVSLHERGQIDLLPLLDARRIQLQARMAKTDGETELLLSTVRLFKALGGGWQPFETPVASQPSHVGDSPNPHHLASNIEESP